MRNQSMIHVLFMWLGTVIITIGGLNLIACADEKASAYCGIEVVDDETKRGIPLVSLTTVDDVTYVTDSSGRVALNEPELWGQTVFFKVTSPGYQGPKDGFGIEGVRLQLNPGQTHVVSMKRLHPAERLYRITGRDLYLDSVRLGHKPAVARPSMAGGVLGQDSVQPVIYNNQIHWFWGDTNRLQYPLGLFRTAGAVSKLPHAVGLSPDEGVDFEYFTGKDEFARAMVDVKEPEGVVWIHGLCLAQSGHANGATKDEMLAQYSRRRGLAEPLEQGLLKWNDSRQIFEVAATVDLRETWRIVSDHPIVCRSTGEAVPVFAPTKTEPSVSASAENWLMFGNPFPMTRVRQSTSAVLTRGEYESFTCREDITDEFPTEEQLANSKPVRDDRGQLMWRWAKQPPVTQKDEHRWLKSGMIKLDEARLLPRDAEQPDRVVVVHSGTVQWNSFRQRWVMIAIEHAWDKSSPSFLGEVFYSEADSPQGPFVKALKIATHPGQSFYNPCHHPFFDQNNGRTVYFEGTYCNTFTQSPATPRYNYNQLMYRLPLDSDRIAKVFGTPAG